MPPAANGSRRWEFERNAPPIAPLRANCARFLIFFRALFLVAGIWASPLLIILIDFRSFSKGQALNFPPGQNQDDSMGKIGFGDGSFHVVGHYDRVDIGATFA